ncbi:Uncharacterized protein DBV15_05795, partial [Temnothorax longispinosus]
MENLNSSSYSIFELIALITIITPLAEEIARGNATLYRCNYVIFTRVIRLALANPLTGVNISRINFPPVKSLDEARCLSKDWSARHRFTNRLSIPR